MVEIEGKSSLLALIAACPLSEAEICRRAGVSPNTITNMRKEPRRDLRWSTARAIIEAMDYKICLKPL